MSTTQNNDLWLSFRSKVASLFYNYGLSRPYSPSLATRSEGFTEVWGEGYPDEGMAECWKQEKDSLAEICTTPAPPNKLTLVQYRPAWAEQLALRVCNVPHIVVNSSYGVTEATGTLPYLRDFSKDKPVLLGRTTSDAILDHLQKHHNLLALDPPNHARKDSQLLRNLIEDKLQTALLVCRYQDWKIFEQVTRKQYLRISSRGQVWSERVSMTSQLPSWSVQQAVNKAHDAYKLFEEHLESRECLLGTTQPSLVDVLLWDHLVQALTDVHLVVVLSDYPNLCRYAQRLWDTYFQNSSEKWQHWNDQENARNVFCRIPFVDNKKVVVVSKAMDLMERLSVTSHQLDERLALVAKNRQNEGTERPFFRTWYRWRMGDRLLPKQRREDASNPEQNEFRRQYKRDDERWIGAVVVGSLLVFGLASARPVQSSS